MRKGTKAGIIATLRPASVEVGIAKLDQEGWSYADEPDWEVWM